LDSRRRQGNMIPAMAASRNQVLTAVTVVLLAAAVYLAVDLNRSGQEEVLRQSQALQTLIARQAAHEVAAHLQERARDLRNLAHLASVQRGDPVQMRADLEAYRNTAEQATEQSPQPSISVLDREGAVVFSTRVGTSTRSLASSNLLEWAQKKENRGKVFVVFGAHASREATRQDHRGGLALATPIWRTDGGIRPAAPGRNWSGLVLLTADLEAIVTRHLSAWSLKPWSTRAWIMDQDGTILLQSEHPEMAQENIFEVKSQCAQCHVSFDYAQQMLSNGVGIAQYQLRGQPTKVAAYAPMQFANASWIVVVNAPYADLTAFARRGYTRMLLLVGMIAAVVSLAAVMVHRTNLSRVEAEAETRRWQEQHRLEGEIRQAEARYRTLFEQSPDGILALDPQSTLPIDFNPAAHRQLGYSRDEFAQLRLSDYEVAETPGASPARLQEVLREGRALFETRHRRKDGEIRTVEVIAQRLELAGRDVVHCIYHDITERKQAEQALELQTEQMRQEAAVKTTLLHDVNHRVKNNLMRLVEIVRLEREVGASSAAGLRAVLGDMESRLQGMAVVHSMLSNRHWEPLPLSDLVTRVIAAALSGSPIRKQIRLSVLAPEDPLWVVPEQATAVALIMNELATNSVKHAFQGREEGCLEVRLLAENQGPGRPWVRLTYRDDGPGWPEATLHGKGRRVGLHLIQASVRSPLRGGLTLRNDGGATAELTFQLALAG
jgi:PAS domain S-box-containing protein